MTLTYPTRLNAFRLRIWSRYYRRLHRPHVHNDFCRKYVVQLSRMYGDVVYNSCYHPNDGGPPSGKENGCGEQHGGARTTSRSVLPDVWVAVCQIKDRHYAALAYRYAACALLPYYQSSADPGGVDHRHHRHHGRRRDRYADDTDAGELLTELMAAAAAVGLELVDDDDTVTSVAARQDRCRKQLGTIDVKKNKIQFNYFELSKMVILSYWGRSDGNVFRTLGRLWSSHRSYRVRERKYERKNFN